MRVAGLFRYPVKGLSPEPMAHVALEEGAYVPGDRIFAIENGKSGFDPQNPVHQTKRKYLMLMRNEALAQLRTRYEEGTGTLVVADGAGEVARGDLATPEGRAAIEDFFAGFLGESLSGRPGVLRAPPGFRFTDSPRGFVSIVGRASIAAVEDRVGAPVDPLRFRPNVLVEDLEPFTELDLVGRVLCAPSGLRLRIGERTVRCAATDVDPATGIRDLQIPKALMQNFGHVDCGVYAEVIAAGVLAVGERLRIEEPVAAGAGSGLPF